MACILLLLLFPLLTSLLLFVYRHLKLRSHLSAIPSLRSYPFIGHGLILKPDHHEAIEQINGMANLYPTHRMVTFWIGPLPIIMIYSISLLDVFYSNMDHLDKGMSYDFLRPWLGNSLVISYAEQWRPRRKLLTPTFHYEILKSFLHTFNHQSERLFQKLHEISELNKGVIKDVAPLISLCALDIICETSMGQSVNAQSESDSDYVKAIIRINDIIHCRQKNPLLWPDPIFMLSGDGKEHNWALKILHSFTRKVINERRELRKTEGLMKGFEGRKAFLDLLLEMEEKGELNEMDVQNEVDNFMFAGHDTTAMAVVWTLFQLGCHQQIQQRVYEEIQSVCGVSNYDVSMDQLGQLTFLECCIKEILRLYPSVPFITRRLGTDAIIGGNKVPAGTQVMLNLYLIHRDTEHWTDPEVFDPNRFLPENMKGRHPFAFVPFSAGSRNCIGQRFALLEEKTMLVWILRNFHISSLKRLDQVYPKAEIILRPATEVPLLLSPRI